GDTQVAVFRLADDTVRAVQQKDPYSGVNLLSRGLVSSHELAGEQAGEVVLTIASPLYKHAWNRVTGDVVDPGGGAHRPIAVLEVGQTPGKHSMRQEEIEEILIGAARAGRRVVRRKGGEPFLLGRGGEEVLACRAAGIEVQVVPGVSSAIAGPAAGEVPVTH